MSNYQELHLLQHFLAAINYSQLMLETHAALLFLLIMKQIKLKPNS